MKIPNQKGEHSC